MTIHLHVYVEGRVCTIGDQCKICMYTYLMFCSMLPGGRNLFKYDIFRLYEGKRMFIIHYIFIGLEKRYMYIIRIQVSQN